MFPNRGLSGPQNSEINLMPVYAVFVGEPGAYRDDATVLHFARLQLELDRRVMNVEALVEVTRGSAAG